MYTLVPAAGAKRSPRKVIFLGLRGIPELIVHNKTGVLVEPGNVAMLAEALASMAKLPRTARNRLGAAGRDWVIREFSPEKYRDRTTELYETVVHSCTRWRSAT